MSGGVRGPARTNSRTAEPQPPPKRHTTTQPPHTTSTTHTIDLHTTIHTPPTTTPSTTSPLEPDPFDHLCTALTSRLQLTSQCMLLLTRILQQLSRSHSPATSSLLPSLRQSLSDAEATHAELLALYDRLVVARIDKRLDGRLRKEKRRRREQMEQEVRDVSSRFKQIRALAAAKLNTNNTSQDSDDDFSTVATYGKPALHHTPYSATQDTQPLLSTHHHHHTTTTTSLHSPPSPPATTLPPTYQTTGLQSLASVAPQELYDQEADAVQRSLFIDQVERDVSTLHEMFVDMHSLVEQQGAVVGGLEAVIGRSAERVRGGLGEVLKAEEYARRRRGRMCCCWVLGGVLLSIVVLVLYALGGSAG